MLKKKLQKPLMMPGDSVRTTLVKTMKERMLSLNSNSSQQGCPVPALTVGQGKMCSVSSCFDSNSSQQGCPMPALTVGQGKMCSVSSC